MEQFEDKVVAVTGAAGGIGRALAIEFARRGAHLAVSDVDEQGLKETAAMVRTYDVEAHAKTVDVADREAVYAWAEEVVEEFGRVNVIVNNAGVACTASVEDLSYEDFEWLMGINFWGVVYGTKAFLPHLRASGEGHVVNISSVFGLIAQPSQSAYNAAKFAVRGFTESLRAELEYEGAPVSATSVHPGGVKTNIARSGRFADTGALERSPDEIIEEFERKLARLSPEGAALQIIEAVRKDERRVLVGTDAQIIDLVQRLMPSGYVGALVKLLRSRYRG
ncbi:SDR family NAD(P)-dependent oxidoreductase [Persicimonas caeni]|uniref:SDR family NAD(P)-dependent oxidoreductase n=1 Tax=Persicimonas caeni TaxID=2292766 RepID=A0A4Y6PYY3_PERCE|nr:SDR family NAD(P)-dependent oxidoreductase [Persicimonas caeni]QDG53473.1 SDR family NAD(P)-dependent oxidoreductase [Persicimonas caeni]QED34694.1 SDR family NAD(P)-dependent oxidoreductase [Persicimonas caeni]